MEKRSIIKGIITVLIALGVIVGVVIIFNNQNFKTYTNYIVKEELPLSGGDTSVYNDYDRFAVSTINGAKAIDGNGKLVWEASFGLENPKVVSCEKVSAIADIGGEDVYVISSSGLPYTYKVSYPIVKICVARQGVTAVLLNNDAKDLIQVYDLEGNLKVEIGTSTKIDGFPVDIALSPDGRKLAAFYISFEGEKLVSKVIFYNFDNVGHNYIENIVGYRSFDDDLLYHVDFLGNDHVGILLKDSFIVYDMKEIPELLCEVNIKEIESKAVGNTDVVTHSVNIRDIAMSDTEIVAVTETDGVNKLHFYSLSGQETKVIYNIPEYEKLSAYGDEVILLKSQQVYIYRKNGRLKFQGTFDRYIEDVGFGGGDKYFIVDSGRVQTIVLSDQKAEKAQGRN